MAVRRLSVTSTDTELSAEEMNAEPKPTISRRKILAIVATILGVAGIFVTLLIYSIMNTQ